MAADRKYVKPNKGGLGLIKIVDLFDSLKVSWFKRIISNGINDNWRHSISKGCFNNIMCFRPDQLNRNERPLEFNIGSGL